MNRSANRLRGAIKQNSIELIEATQNDKALLEECVNDLSYITEFTGWNEFSEDEAQDLLDHKELPQNGSKENDRYIYKERRDTCRLL